MIVTLADKEVCVCLGNRAAFAWFSVEPGWFESSTERIAQAEAQAFSSFAQALALDRPEVANQVDPYPSKRTSRSGPQLPPSTYMQLQVTIPY